MPVINPLITASSCHHILIRRNIKVPAPVLRANKCQKNDIRIHTPHEDANDKSILVSLRLALGREREPLTNRRFNRTTRTAHEVSKLVTSTDNKRPEATRAQFHKMDGNHAPGALDTELLEEGGGNDALVGDEGVGVQQDAAENTHADYAEAAAEDGGAVADDGAAGHGAEVGDDLGDGYGVGGEVVLVGEHGWVQILGAVGHEVEAWE